MAPRYGAKMAPRWRRDMAPRYGAEIWCRDGAEVWCRDRAEMWCRDGADDVEKEKVRAVYTATHIPVERAVELVTSLKSAQEVKHLRDE